MTAQATIATLEQIHAILKQHRMTPIMGASGYSLGDIDHLIDQCLQHARIGITNPHLADGRLAEITGWLNSAACEQNEHIDAAIAILTAA